MKHPNEIAWTALACLFLLMPSLARAEDAPVAKQEAPGTPTAPPVLAAPAPDPEASTPLPETTRPGRDPSDHTEPLVELLADPGTAFWEHTGTLERVRKPSLGIYSPLCTAPCAIRLPEGDHTLAISHEGEAPTDLVGSVAVGVKGARVRVEQVRVSRQSTRSAGKIVFWSSIFVALPVLIAGVVATRTNPPAAT